MPDGVSTPANAIDAEGASAPSTSLAAADGLRALLLACIAVALALALTAALIMISGKSPLAAYWALLKGAVGSADRIAFGLNKSTPYILAGVGVALCFRARIINIGAEGQIAVGGLAASWVALHAAAWLGVVVVPLAILAAALGGAIWAAFAAVIRLKRGVHEVLCTLLLNFVGILLVSEALHGEMGEPGAGFPQSPLFEASAWLPKLLPGTDLHIGIVIAALTAVAGHALLWRTTFGFRLRLLGASPTAAAYAGVSFSRCAFAVMAIAGAVAGIAGGIEVLGVHYRLIEGFSLGFGFNAVAVALLASINPAAVLPAGLFLGFLEAGALAMQREVGVPSSLVFVIQGLMMVFVLCAFGIGIRRQRV
jgi:simple sugar transport system permease protein